MLSRVFSTKNNIFLWKFPSLVKSVFRMFYFRREQAMQRWWKVEKTLWKKKVAMQVEEVIHNSRLYSILIKERHGEKIEGEEELFFSPWSRNGFLSDIKTVQRQRYSIKMSVFIHRFDLEVNQAIFACPWYIE